MAESGSNFDRKKEEEISTEYQAWMVFSSEKIDQAVKEGNLSELKFFLGPAFYPLQRRADNDLKHEIEWKKLAIQFEADLYQEIKSTVEIYAQYVRNKHLLTLIRTKLTTENVLPGLKSNIVSLIESHDAVVEAIKSGNLSSYKTWLKKNGDRLPGLYQGTSYGLTPSHIADQDIQLHTQERAELQKLLNNIKIEKHEKEQASYFEVLKNNIISHLSSHRYLKFLLKDVHHYSQEARRRWHSPLEAHGYAMEKEIAEYKAFSKEYLSVPENFSQILLFTQPNNLSGMSSDAFIAWIVQNKQKHSLCFRDDKSIHEVFISANGHQDPLLKQALTFQLAKHCAYDPRVRDSKQLIQTYRTPSQPEQKLASLIDAPLSWRELQLALDYVTCISQTQVHLKRQLQCYFHERENPFSSHHPTEEERRQIQYLIVSLLLAAEGMGEEMLFLTAGQGKSGEQKTQKPPAVNFILKELTSSVGTTSTSSSWLARLCTGSSPSLKMRLITFMADPSDEKTRHDEIHRAMGRKRLQMEKQLAKNAVHQFGLYKSLKNQDGASSSNEAVPLLTLKEQERRSKKNKV